MQLLCRIQKGVHSNGEADKYLTYKYQITTTMKKYVEKCIEKATEKNLAINTNNKNQRKTLLSIDDYKIDKPLQMACYVLAKYVPALIFAVVKLI